MPSFCIASLHREDNAEVAAGGVGVELAVSADGEGGGSQVGGAEGGGEAVLGEDVGELFVVVDNEFLTICRRRFYMSAYHAKPPSCGRFAWRISDSSWLCHENPPSYGRIAW